MRELSAAFASHLRSGATTLCHCWKLTRRDNAVQGFTDHDRSITLDGVVYKASTGFTASALESGLGLHVSNMDAAGALSSSGLSDDAIARGDYDGADVEIRRVNWQQPEQNVLLTKGEIGEIRRTQNGWTAELRSPVWRLAQPAGHLYQYHCDAVLGDKRCGFNVQTAGFFGEGTIAGYDDNLVRVSGFEDFPEGRFSLGVMRILSGVHAAAEMEIRRHFRRAGQDWLEFVFLPNPPPPIGSAVRLSVGCDKSFASCKTIFSNQHNYRGFPHMPGNDYVQAPPSTKEGA